MENHLALIKFQFWSVRRSDTCMVVLINPQVLNKRTIKILIEETPQESLKTSTITIAIAVGY